MVRLTWVVYGKLLAEQHSIMALSSILKREGIDSTLIYTNRLKDIISKIKQLRPDIVAYSLMFGNHWHYKPVSQAIRREFPGILQVAGGYPVLKRCLPIVFKMPMIFLDYFSMFTKIFIIIRYLPRARWNIIQRIKVFF